jgi:predicted  nucleic acid-binding Zn-ribbon protein
LNPLTKIFVVLHVVLSLLLTAGLIVFVNRTENFAATIAAKETSRIAAVNRANAADSDALAAREAATAAVAAVNAKIKDVQAQLSAAQTQIDQKDAALAQAGSSAALAAADSSRLTEALKASEDQKSKQQDIITQIRTDDAALVKKDSDLNITVSDLTNKLDVASRERENFGEQLHEATSQNENLVKILGDNGINPNQVGGIRANGGAVPINGIVRDTRVINGIPYATISVGSADNVQKGMEFNVIDRQRGQFLGKMTIDSVEPHEATGRLEGPRVDDVKAGIEVRTQL